MRQRFLHAIEKNMVRSIQLLLYHANSSPESGEEVVRQIWFFHAHEYHSFLQFFNL
jgi:hypothetical protein